MSARLTGGILAECFQKVRRHFYETIDASVHAKTYEGTHDTHYAEPEFTGKYLDICACFFEREKDDRAYQKGMEVFESIEKNQRADGYLGCLEQGNEYRAFSVWNHGFTLYGLIRLYEALADERILQCAIRGADWLEGAFFKADSPDILEATNQGSQHISCLLSMGKIYALTGFARYKDFIKNLINRCEGSAMNLLSFADILALMSKKGIEMLVVYLGVLQYGRLLGDERAIAAARRYWEQIRHTQIRNTGNGTVREVWTEKGNAHRLMATEEKPNETCVAVGWTELSLALFYQEPQARYLDAVEKTLFNHLLGSLDRQGKDFAYYQGNFGEKIFRTPGGMYQCCRYRGFTLFSYLQDCLYDANAQRVIPMIYAASEYRAEDLYIRQETEYPAKGVISFHVENGGKERNLLLRIPAWCREWALRVNGRACFPENREGFLSILIACGETDICLNLSMAPQKEICEIEGKPYACWHFGPLLLARVVREEGCLWEAVQADAPILPHAPENSLAAFEWGGGLLKDFASAGQEKGEIYTVYIPVQ